MWSSMVLKRGYVTLLYTVRYGSHTVHRSNYAVLAVRCKFQDSVFLRLTVRCDTVRYGNLLQYYNTVYTTGYTAAPLYSAHSAPLHCPPLDCPIAPRAPLG